VSQPSLEQVHLAKLLRRDVEPNEPRVRVRARTCSSSLIWRGHLIALDEEALSSAVVDSEIPMRFGWVELEMFASEAESFKAEVEAKRATSEQIRDAVKDLRSDLEGLEAVDADASPADILAAFDLGELKGTTPKTYRPSFPASFRATNRVKGEGLDFYPVIAVEIVAPDDKKATTRKAA